MEFFATNEELAQLEARLAQMLEHDPARLPLLVEVAWQMRQRNSQRALELIAQAEPLIAPRQTPALSLRLLLVRAEVELSMDDFTACISSAEQARLGFAQLGDALGQADAYWPLAWVWLNQGKMEQMHQAMAAMAKFSESDEVRYMTAQAAQGIYLAFADVERAVNQWGQKLPFVAPHLHTGARAWLLNFWKIVAMQHEDFMQAIALGSQSYPYALESGQIWCAVNTALSVGWSFKALNDFESALIWMEKGLSLARTSTWPGLIGTALYRTAEVLMHLKSYDAAHTLISEAPELMNACSSSRIYTLILKNMGNMELARGQFEYALASFDSMAQRAQALHYLDLLEAAHLGQAKALLGLGRPEVALPLLARTVQSGSIRNQISALRVLAQAHSRHPLALPPDCTSNNATLHYLQLALKRTENLQNYTIPSDFLQEISEEYAKQGDFQQAWLLGKQAAARARQNA